MPIAASGAPEGLILSVALFLLAAYFGVNQWRDRRRRSPDLSAEDRAHFARQDIRRGIGSFVMALIAVGLVVGTRINVRAGRAAGRLFLGTWLVVAALVFVLLILALLDWRAIRAYAHRHREALANERYAALQEERRRLSGRKKGRDGPLDGPSPPLN